MENACIFSTCRTFRYSLHHKLDGGDLFAAETRRIFVWIGLNPSTADERKLDPTLRRVREFTRRLGGTDFVMLNLFAYRATDPRVMLNHLDIGHQVIGPENDRIIKSWTDQAIEIVACWGHLGKTNGRDDAVRRLIERPIKCLGRTVGGQPAHPLYLPAERGLIPL